MYAIVQQAVKANVIQSVERVNFFLSLCSLDYVIGPPDNAHYAPLQETNHFATAYIQFKIIIAMICCYEGGGADLDYICGE